MIELLELLGNNALVASALVGVALLADRLAPWPAVRHVVWVAVLVRLLVPPLLPIEVPLPAQSVPDSFVAVSPLLHTNVPSDPALLDSLPVAVTGSTRSVIGMLPRLALGIELAGVVLILLLAAVRIGQVRRRLRLTEPASGEIVQRAEELGARIGLGRVPRIRITRESWSPMLVAVPHSTIVIPAAIVDRLDDDEMDALLAHELAHARRKDTWIRPMELLATAFYWWLPTLWLARRRLRSAEEAACDVLVVSALPQTKRAYAESLLKTLELTSSSAPSPVLATGALQSRDLKERIVMILKPSTVRPLPKLAWGLVLLLLIATLAVAPSWAPAQAEDSEADETALELLELERREAQLHLERQRIELELQQDQLDLEIQAIQMKRHLAQTRRELEELSRSGRESEAQDLRRELARMEAQTALDGQILEQEAELRLQRAQLHLESQTMELEYATAMSRGETSEAEALASRMHQRAQEMHSLEMRQMEIDLQRKRAELEMAEQFLQQLRETATNND